MIDDKNSNRPFRRRSYADEDRMRELVDEVYRFSEKRYPFLVGTIVWLLRQIGKSLAFNLKVVLRRDMGVRSYGVGLMVEALIVQKLYLFVSLYIYAQLPVSDLLYLFVPGSDMWNGFWELMVFWVPNFQTLEALPPENRFEYFLQHIPFVFGYIFGFRCVFALIEKSQNLGKPIHSYGSGDSILFGWLQKLGVPERTLLMVVEPAIVFALGLLILMASDATGYKTFGDFLMTCSLALFFEEYLPHARRRRIVQDRIDAQFEMAKIEELAALMESEGQSAAAKRVPAALADAKDAERYRVEMGRMVGRREGAARL